MKTLAILFLFRGLLLLPLIVSLDAAPESARPNILWITSEDNSPYLGCYGDALATTPNLDKFASQGMRYRNAFSHAPVCSTARATLISGMYSSTLGTLHHRSRVEIPANFKLYSDHLKAAGYYCTNQSKTDYNIEGNQGGWDDSSPKAHYRNRKLGQPFFAIFNLMASHEGQAGAKPGKREFGIAPEKIQLPPYISDTPTIRRDWANYYDQMTLMDEQVGGVLDELDKSGHAENTIVFYFSDHGGALPRGKRNIHDSGTRVPLIIRFPERWSRFSPAKPGEWVDELVGFVDLPPTVFNLCGVPVPQNYQGRAFLGDVTTKPREQVFLFRGRMDERYDTVRAIRGTDHRYVRNYSPHRSWGQHYSFAFSVLPSLRSWYEEFVEGRCNPAQAAYWQPKPGEELYQISSDPFEIRNLADDAAQGARLSAMRAALRAEILATRDTGFIPEGMFGKLAGSRTLYDYAQSSAYPLERILDLADLASGNNPAALPALIAALDDRHPVMRYWAATGCLILKEQAAPAKDKLQALLIDPSPDVQVIAAEAIAWLGEAEAAAAALARVLNIGNLHEVLAAQNAVDFTWQAGHLSLSDARKLVGGGKAREPADRIPTYLRN